MIRRTSSPRIVYATNSHAADGADRLIPALAVRAWIDHNQQVRVIENFGGGSEVHPMLFDVPAGLDRIPFEFHAMILYGSAVGCYPATARRRRVRG
jgi:hypothetical protein